MTSADIDAMLIASPQASRAPHAAFEADEHNDAVLRMQVLLDRARFGPGEIDAIFGSNVAKALAGFQTSRGLEPTGEPDAATWIELEREGLPVLIEYEVTEADIAGPFFVMPDRPLDKSKLAALGFASITEALAERFHVSPALLQTLNPDTDFQQAGAVIRAPNVEGVPALEGAHQLVVSQSSLTVSVLDADGKVIAQFPASTGSSHDPLPLGDWKITGVATDPVYNYDPDLFWNADPSHVKVQLPAGPNNPVGTVWIGLSKPHYGIHGTPEPANIGKTQSAGCIRLTNWDALVLAHAVSAGMPAVLIE